jgi:hypothetical protein
LVAVRALEAPRVQHGAAQAAGQGLHLESRRGWMPVSRAGVALEGGDHTPGEPNPRHRPSEWRTLDAGRWTA